MMRECVDKFQTPVLWCDKKKNRACFESSLFPWVFQMYQAASVNRLVSCSTLLVWQHELK